MNTTQKLLLTASLALILGIPTPSPADQEVPRRDTVSPPPSSVSDTDRGRAAQEETESGDQPDYVLKPWRSLRGHLHNKLIHIPIGFGLAAFFLSILSLRWPEIRPAIRWLVLIAALGSIAAYITGTAQAAALEGSSKEWVVEIHENLGIATAALLWIWTACAWIRRLQRWEVLAGFLAVALITAAGFFGGVIAHG